MHGLLLQFYRVRTLTNISVCGIFLLLAFYFSSQHVLRLSKEFLKNNLEK